MVIDYYFVLISPWTYLGHERFEALAAQYGATVNHKPVQGSAVFRASGGLQLKDRPKQRQAYRMQELRRWREHLDAPLNLEPRHFPVPDEHAARMVIAARRRGEAPGRLVGAYLRACWAEERDISAPDTVRAIAVEAGHDVDDLVKATSDPAVQGEYDANTAEAIERQVFGFPTYAFGNELLWGQDRLDFVERILARG